MKLRSKPSSKWVCDTCTKSKKKKVSTAAESPLELSGFKFHKKQYRPSTHDDDDSDVEMAAPRSARSSIAEKDDRRSSRRKRESSPITPTPASSRLSSSRRNRVSTELLLDHVMMDKFLDEIKKHTCAWPFRSPVEKREVPDYYKVIKTPMDLAKIKSNLNVGKYSSNYEVVSDLQLIFGNCDLYNSRNLKSTSKSAMQCLLFRVPSISYLIYL